MGLIANKIEERLEKMSQNSWHRVFEQNGKLEALFEIASVVDKIDHNCSVSDKETHKNTRKFLFVVNPDGPSKDDSSRLRQTYGKKVLNGTARSLRVPMYANVDTLYDNKYKFRLIIDREEEKVYIRIVGVRGKFYEQKVYWTFDTLKKMAETKIKKYVIVEHESKYVGLDELYRIKQVLVYEDVNFDKFLEQLELGNIRVYLKVAVYMSGIYIGKTHDHGATFQIYDRCKANLYDACYIRSKFGDK